MTGVAPPVGLGQGAVLFLVAGVAGAINSVAGGGTLLTFPALVWAGLDPILANTTNTVTLWPGSLAAMIGFRRELRGSGRWMLLLSLPSLVGGAAGAWLLLRTPSPLFAGLAPYLIFFATALFALHGPIARRLRPGHHLPTPTGAAWAGAALFQLAVAIYGGYFGAGIGILMLSALGLVGFTDIHQMSGLRNFLAICINGVAATYFIAAGRVSWPYALVMLGGQVAGGYGGATLARQLGRRFVRRFIVAVGAAMALSLLVAR